MELWLTHDKHHFCHIEGKNALYVFLRSGPRPTDSLIPGLGTGSKVVVPLVKGEEIIDRFVLERFGTHTGFGGDPDKIARPILEPKVGGQLGQHKHPEHRAQEELHAASFLLVTLTRAPVFSRDNHQPTHPMAA